MKLVSGVTSVPGPAPGAERAELRKLSQALEGVFVRQLIAAMRESVPKSDGLGSEGQQVFTDMFDDTLARLVAERMQRGMSEALYQELSRRLPPESGQAVKE